VTSPKPPTAQGISRLLAKAGFERAGFGLPTRFHHDGRPILTSRPPVPGFQVRDDGFGTVVRWKHGRVVNLDAMDQERASCLAAYAKTITEAGWAVEPMSYAGTAVHHLIVTAKEGD